MAEVIKFLRTQDNSSLSILDLSKKTVVLMTLTRPCQLAEVASLDFSSLRYSPEGVTISPLRPPKQARVGSNLKDYFFPRFGEDPNICPVNTIECYCKKTEAVRSQSNHLFLSSVMPFQPSTSATIARWIKTTLAGAGIDTSIFGAHSTRGAASSAAADAGLSISEILEAADWSSATTFERFYYRPQQAKKAFGVSVLKTASNLHS